MARLAGALGVHPLAARVLAARGLEDPAAAGRFLAPRLEDLPDPFSMKGMEGAVARIVAAVAGGERSACYGDYGVDGGTSTGLLSAF
ncbi:MAG TPA: single-stranded-DNA-specific exonuclease RecJ, partial [Anaeromyxobacteraceae bacterium]|nr:single-stranded-DNA-specific exonuclease RecJ [Anaeromyxobacteraceae bacterium]